MSVDNRTPFPAIAFRQYNLAGAMNGVVAVRGTFRLVEHSPLEAANEQLPLVMSDVYDGDPHAAPQMACTDLAPFKPGTDVTFVGTTFAPGDRAVSSWSCGLKVGPVGKRLRVTGPRIWRARTRKTWKGLVGLGPEDALDGWDLSDPEPAVAVPIDWRLAYGGRLPAATEDAPDGVDPFNPVGVGIVDAARFPEITAWPAPQIVREDDPRADPQEGWTPEGLGPIAPFWRQRQRLAGTYDQDWLDHRHPLLPRDFDFRFWQCAHPDLIAEPWLAGDETFTLDNLVKGYPGLTGRLPGLQLTTRVEQPEGWIVVQLVLDGVHFDLRPGVGRVFLTWRAGFPWAERLSLPILEADAGRHEAAL